MKRTCIPMIVKYHPSFRQSSSRKPSLSVIPAIFKPEAITIRHSGNLQAGSQEGEMNRQPAVYILSNKRNGTLYVGVTSDLVKRVWEHRNNFVEGFTKRYGVHNLVWYELHKRMASAIQREKRLKDWKRKWKVHLIERKNPDWKDLYHAII